MASKKKAKPGPVRLAVSDGLMMALWAMCSSIFGEIAELGSLRSGLDEFMLNIVILVLALILVTWICERYPFFSGCVFNPCNNAALYMSGREPGLTSIIRMAGQLVGAVAGSFAAWILVPVSLQGKFHYLAGGLKDGAAFVEGFAAEAVLGLFLNLIFLYCMDTKNKAIVFWVPLVNTVINCIIGSYFTGPSLNPYLSFSWNFIHQTQSFEEHLIIFHAAPFVGALSAGVLYTYATRQTKPKAKKKTSNKVDYAVPVTPRSTGMTTRSKAAASAKASAQKSTKGKQGAFGDRKKTK